MISVDVSPDTEVEVVSMTSTVTVPLVSLVSLVVVVVSIVASTEVVIDSISVVDTSIDISLSVAV